MFDSDPSLDGAVAWGHHLPMLAMLAYAGARRRSLGAERCLMAAFAGALAALMLCATRDLTSLPVRLADLLVMPVLLFILARRQSIPGLRRGQMTQEERGRWISDAIATKLVKTISESPSATRLRLARPINDRQK